MKLVIDISEEAYNTIEKIQFLVGGRNDRRLQCEMIKAIKSGVPLEQEFFDDKVRKMKSEIASSLEFWGYSSTHHNNPLARDMLETLKYFWGEIEDGNVD